MRLESVKAKTMKSLGVLVLFTLQSMSLGSQENSNALGDGDMSTTAHTTLVDNLNLTFRGDFHRATVHSHKKVVVCYVGTWSTYRTPKEGAFDVDDLEPRLCTHLIYSFAGLDNTTFVMKPLDPWLDQKLEDNGGGRDWFKKFTDLKGKYPHLKVLLAIGGWNEGSKKYSDMAASSTNRQTFITSALDLIRQYNFDGLDLDWEFPADRGGRPEDKRHFTILVQELRQKFDKYGLLLTSAFGPVRSTAEKGYELAPLAKLLDHVHLMCYDYHGAWDKQTGHNAPLFAPSGQPSISSSVEYYMSQGVPANKIVLGLPFYGRTFLIDGLAQGQENLGKIEGEGGSLGVKAGDKGFQGPFTKEDGFLGYNEICKELNANRGEWSTFWDNKAKVPFMRNGNKWVTFDNPDSIREKVKYIVQKKLRGAMIWSIDTDDLRSYCGPIKNPLLRTVNYALYHAHSTSPDSDSDSGRPGPPSADATCPIVPFITIFSLVTLLLSLL